MLRGNKRRKKKYDFFRKPDFGRITGTAIACKDNTKKKDLTSFRTSDLGHGQILEQRASSFFFSDYKITRLGSEECVCKLKSWSTTTNVKQDSPSMMVVSAAKVANEFLDGRDETRPLGGEGRSGGLGEEWLLGASPSRPLYLKVIAAWIYFYSFPSVTRGDAWSV